MRPWRLEWGVPTTGAILQARDRLGEAPLKMLFERVAVPLAAAGTPGAWLGEPRLMAIDGVKIDVPDTPANIDGFGRPGGLTRRPFPQIQVIGLGECGTHAVVAAEIGTVSIGEREIASGLVPALEPGMLVIADRGESSSGWGRSSEQNAGGTGSCKESCSYSPTGRGCPSSNGFDEKSRVTGDC
jgi:Insertion element 4 transposase N-terminal